MITKITMNQVASYKDPVFLETDKKVNLIYGLNGVGKSILSEFLYDNSDTRFSNCSIEGLNNEDILVYNQKFIQDYFYEPENLKGIFTLSKENKDAEQKVKNAEQEIKKLDGEKEQKNNEITNLNKELTEKKQSAENKTWEIKEKFSGGDRILKFCLTGLMGKKEALYNHISFIPKPGQQPSKTSDDLKKESEKIKGDKAQKYDLLPELTISVQEIESNSLFGKAIIGNQNSAVGELIDRLQNSDWVKSGLEYIPREISEDGESCPFCQNNTITKSLAEDIQGYFDASYENDMSELKRLASEYQNKIESLPKIESYENSPFVNEKISEFKNLFNSVIQLLASNISKISDKIKAPSQLISLSNSVEKIEATNHFIRDINKAVNDHNQKIDNLDVELSKIKTEFWNIMRWVYEQTISTCQNEQTRIQEKIQKMKSVISKIDENITVKRTIIAELQKQTINIDEAIAHINNGLSELGLEGFRINKYSNTLYQLTRENLNENAFRTLSEGEKMLISFLYFLELCKGKKSSTEATNRKVVVIDDPISSLSHIYIFNVGQVIKNEFFNSNEYEQIFVLTHSLYFFYEIADRKEERRKRTQNLFRIEKNMNGSRILPLKYDDIQNDYHSYWQVIKNNNQQPALIANCMRSIIEYFFGFVEDERSLNDIFQKSELSENKYQAFCRYIDRESHSVGQNIFDFKEFDYDIFKDGLSLVFETCGYKEHYEKMIK